MVAGKFSGASKGGVLLAWKFFISVCLGKKCSGVVVKSLISLFSRVVFKRQFLSWTHSDNKLNLHFAAI